MLLRDLIKEGVNAISMLYPEREAREMVFIFLQHELGIKRHTHIMEPDYEVEAPDAGRIMEAFRCIASGMPLQYLMGKAYFYGREFRVTPDVLIPRPETEYLCRTVLDINKSSENLSVLDLCTGSGCIAWTLALEKPGSLVTAIDISYAALKVAGSQDFDADITATGAFKPTFFQADILHSPESFDAEKSSFDILVSNPPYVKLSEKSLMRSNVLDHEPELALFVSDDDPLIFYRAVSEWALYFLKEGGLCMVEINEALGPETAEVFVTSGFADVEIICDLNSKERFVLARKR